MFLYHIVVKSATLNQGRSLYKFVIARDIKEANIKVQNRMQKALDELSPTSTITVKIKESWMISTLADITKVKALIIE